MNDKQTIKRLEAENARLRAALYTDRLTGLPNDTALSDAIAARPTALVVLADLDGFKAVNDSIGMAEGDNVLREFARFLLGTTRQNEADRSIDFVAYRVHGDEFVILTDTIDGAVAISTRIDAWQGPHGTSATTGVGQGVNAAGVAMRANKAPSVR